MSCRTSDDGLAQVTWFTSTRTQPCLPVTSIRWSRRGMARRSPRRNSLPCRGSWICGSARRSGGRVDLQLGLEVASSDGGTGCAMAMDGPDPPPSPNEGSPWSRKPRYRQKWCRSASWPRRRRSSSRAATASCHWWNAASPSTIDGFSGMITGSVTVFNRPTSPTHPAPGFCSLMEMSALLQRPPAMVPPIAASTVAPSTSRPVTVMPLMDPGSA